MARYSQRGVVALATLSLVLGTAACSTGSDDEGKSGGNVTYALRSDPGNLDPSLSTSSAGLQLDGLAYDALVTVREDGKIISNLAAKWSATATRAEFTLKSGVKCDDGHTLTATDVAANFNWIKDPKNHSPLIGSDLPDTGFSVAADDSTRVLTISFTRPNGFLLNQLAGIYIVCPGSINNRKKLAQGTDGTGPFRVVSANPGQSYELTTRKGYKWGPDGATTADPKFPKKLTVVVSNNETTAANQLLTGELNVADIRGPDTSRLLGRKLFRQTYPHLTSELFFNQAKGRPLADPVVRKAIVQTLDIAQIAKVNTGDLGTAATRLTDGGGEPCSTDVVASSLPKHDVAAANQALDDAGWTRGDGGKRSKNGKALKLTLIYPSNAQTSVAAAQLLSAMLDKDLHITVEDAPLTPAAIDGRWSQAGNWGDLALARASSQLPSNLVGQFSGDGPPNGINFSGIDNPEYESLAARAYSVAGTASCALWNQASSALLSQANVAPVAAQDSSFFGNGVTFKVSAGAVVPTSIRTK